MSTLIKINRLLGMLVIIVLVTIIGLAAVTISEAATPVTSVEPENGLITGNATKNVLPLASNGSAIKFGSTVKVAGYPNVSNTGYAAAGYSRLTPHTGDWVINTPGTYTGYDVSGTLTITADNVVFQGCNVHGATGGDLITIRGANVQILDCDIHGDNNTTAGSPQNSWIQIFNQNFTLKRSNLYNSSGDGIRDAGAPGMVIEDNYIHDWVQNPTNGPHSDGITDAVDGNTGPWTIRHNTIYMWSNAGLTNVISLAAGNYLLHDIIVDNNLLGGGGYTVHGGGDTNYSNLTFSNNKFTTLFSPVCGEYGIMVTPPIWGTRGTLWSNNTWNDGSQVGQIISNP